MTEQDRQDLTAEQRAARDAVRGLREVTADPMFRSRLAREFASGQFTPHRVREPEHPSRAVAFLRWAYVPAAAAALFAVLFLWNRGPAWEVVGTSPGGTLSINGETVSVGDSDRLDALLRPGAEIALSPKTELTLSTRNAVALQLAPGTVMTLPGRPNRWYPRTLRTTVDAGEARFLTGSRFSGHILAMATPEGHAEITGTIVSVFRDPAMGATCVCVMEGTARIGTSPEDMEPVEQGMRKVMFSGDRPPLVSPILPEHRDGLVRFQRTYDFSRDDASSR
jgi:hypothetical protein